MSWTWEWISKVFGSHVNSVGRSRASSKSVACSTVNMPCPSAPMTRKPPHTDIAPKVPGEFDLIPHFPEVAE
jgi:hypothetical protein